MTARRRRPEPRPKRDPSLPARAVILTRLSKGDRKSVSHKTQIEHCELWAEREGQVVVAWLCDDDISGDRVERPGLQQAMAMLRNGHADVLLVWKYDRLIRDSKRAEVLIAEIEQHGSLIAVTQPIPPGEDGALVRRIYHWMDEKAIRIGRERVNAAFETRYVKERKYKPGAKPPYGYRQVGTKTEATFEEHPEHAEIIRRIFHERAIGRSNYQILAGLNADRVPPPSGEGHWLSGTVSRYVRDETYWTGLRWSRRTETRRDPDDDNRPYTVPRPIEERYQAEGFPILVDGTTAQVAAAAAERNTWNTTRHDRQREDAVLSRGFARCAACGRAMSAAIDNRGVTQYQCTAKRPKLLRPGEAPPERTCEARPVIRASTLDDEVFEALLRMMMNPEQGESWALVESADDPDPKKLAALQAATDRATALTARVDCLIDELDRAEKGSRVTERIWHKLHALEADLDQAVTTRNRLQAELDALAERTSAPRVAPRTVIAQAAAAAVAAAWKADSEPTEIREVTFHPVIGEPVVVPFPVSWAAKRAMLSTLQARVDVRPAKRGERWSLLLTINDRYRMVSGAGLDMEGVVTAIKRRMPAWRNQDRAKVQMIKAEAASGRPRRTDPTVWHHVQTVLGPLATPSATAAEVAMVADTWELATHSPV